MDIKQLFEDKLNEAFNNRLLLEAKFKVDRIRYSAVVPWMNLHKSKMGNEEGFEYPENLIAALTNKNSFEDAIDDLTMLMKNSDTNVVYMGNKTQAEIYMPTGNDIKFNKDLKLKPYLTFRSGTWKLDTNKQVISLSSLKDSIPSDGILGVTKIY